MDERREKLVLPGLRAFPGGAVERSTAELSAANLSHPRRGQIVNQFRCALQSRPPKSTRPPW